MKLGLFAPAFAAAFFALTGISLGANAQSYDLTVQVSGLRNYSGHLVLALWTNSQDTARFPDAGKVQYRDERSGDLACDFPNVSICRRVLDSLQSLAVSYTFKSVPAGDYAVFVFHDENSNGILDTGLFKRPLEARGYSGVLPEDVSPLVAKIKFDQARFTLDGPKAISIGLRYPPRV
jgi:uncharacterized protein (DUF2141 family)